MTPRTRSLTFATATALVLGGCLERELTPVNPCAQQGTDQAVQITNVDKVDLLFMIDNSGSMAEEQRALQEELPEIIQVLASGDLEFGREGDPGAGVQDFQPVRDLHVGVISSDMGTGGFQQDGCDNATFGDDGILQVDGNPSGEPIPDPTADGGGAAPPIDCEDDYLGPDGERFLSFENPDGQRCETEPETCNQFIRDFACVSALGTRGCGFEQQLDAILKSLIPNVPSCNQPFCQFFQGSRGQGNNPATNDGFLREDSLLAVLVLTDEEDCSAANPDLFNRNSGRFFGNLNLRCTDNPEALYDIERYVDGFLSLRQDPNLFIFSVIAGVPADLVRSATREEDNTQDFDIILADSRMVPRPRADGDGLEPSCNSANGSADPPRRFVQVARDLEARGAGAVVQSICQSDFQPAIEAILDKVARVLGEACLPRPLNPDASGRVNCSVIETLPADGTTCADLEGRVRVGTVVDPETMEASEVCEVVQVPATNRQIPNGAGWFYDDFSNDAVGNCPSDQPQRISYIPGSEPVTNTSVRLQCLQPVQGTSDTDTGGLVDVRLGTSCTPFPSSQDAENLCGGVTSPGFTNANICDPFTRGCQAPCTSSADCGPGFLCDVNRLELVDQSAPLRGALPDGITDPTDGDCPNNGDPDTLSDFIVNAEEGTCFQCALPYQPTVEVIDGLGDNDEANDRSLCVRPCSDDSDCSQDGVTGRCIDEEDVGSVCSLPTTCVDPTCSG
jgi:hypothetical protein